MDEIIRKISNGKAILFVGAGFSKSARNILNNDELPLAKDLAKTIGELGEFDDGGDLKYAADYFLNVCCTKNTSLKDNLIKILKDIFTIKECKEEHKWVVKVPWKRVYTTNYDDLVEITGRSIGKRFETVDIDDSTEKYSADQICMHLNGSINTLDHYTINSKFKLSYSSYLSPESFTKSNWNFIFKNDLELSSCIVFIGYSLYDIDIEKILYENPHFQNKVFFIQREKDEKDTTREDYTLNKYGRVYRIGLSGFASMIEAGYGVIQSAIEEFYTEAFSRYEISDKINQTIREQEIESFLRHGELSINYIEDGLTSLQSAPFLIKRAKLDNLLSFTKENQIVCVTSELGNGKTFFLKEAAILLTLEGYVVYTITDLSRSYISDVEKILFHNSNCVIIIDNYGNYKDLICFLLSVNLKDMKVILSERTPNHHSFFRLYDGKLKTKDLNIDILTEDEIRFLVEIINHTSLWGKKYGKYSNEEKKRHIEKECKKQLSIVLIDILKSKHIKDEIEKLLNSIFKDDLIKLNIFIICLLDVMNIPVNLSLLSELTRDDFALSKFSNSSKIRHLFTLNLFDSAVLTKSSIYSLHLLTEHFNPDYIIDNCLLILKMMEEKFVKNKYLDQTRNDIRINLFRFKFIETILPMSTKTGMLVRYFEEIKNILPYHKDNPQYWLQYGMAHIAMRNYEKSERYLDAAYDKAKFRPDYDVYKIDNQKARLNIKIASLSSTKIEDSMKLFIDADNLLSKNNNDVYKFKIVLNYSDFYLAKKNTLSKPQKLRFRQACLHKLRDLERIKTYDTDNFKQERVYRDCEDELVVIINELSDYKI